MIIEKKMYLLPGEEPMTMRQFLRKAGRAVGFLIVYGSSAVVVFLFAYAVVNSVGYP